MPEKWLTVSLLTVWLNTVPLTPSPVSRPWRPVRSQSSGTSPCICACWIARMEGRVFCLPRPPLPGTDIHHGKAQQLSGTINTSQKAQAHRFSNTVSRSRINKRMFAVQSTPSAHDHLVENQDTLVGMLHNLHGWWADVRGKSRCGCQVSSPHSAPPHGVATCSSYTI